MRTAKKYGKRLVKLVKQNGYYLITLIYMVIGAAYSSRLIFKYGEGNFLLFYMIGFLVLIFLLKLFSKKYRQKN